MILYSFSVQLIQDFLWHMQEKDPDIPKDCCQPCPVQYQKEWKSAQL